MVSLKRAVALGVLFVAGVALVMGQDTGNDEELSVEESYLQESIEMMVIQEHTRVNNRESKLIALQYIEDAIERGNKGDDVRVALEFISLEGIINKTTESGRVTNNFPDVRAKAAIQLGNMGTPEAKDTLLRALVAEPEPMVLIEVVKSLGKIGLNDNDETANTIAWIVTRFDVLNPDNLLALAALDAYDNLATKNGGIKDPSALRSIMRISTGPYIKPVQQRAREVMNKLLKSANQGS